MHSILAFLAVFGGTSCLASPFYLPGVASHSFNRRDEVPLMVNKLTSTKTQMPYRFYTLPFCKPSGGTPERETLGEVLMGDRIEPSGYHLQMKINERCKILCRREYTADQGSQFADFIENEYTVSWLMDNMPASVRLINPDDLSDTSLERSFPLGYKMDTPTGPAYYLYNHIHFIVSYHMEEDDEAAAEEEAARSGAEVPASARPAHIIGVEVEPYSVRHQYEDVWPMEHQTGDPQPEVQLDTCNQGQDVVRDLPQQRIDQGGEVIFTYDVIWQETSTPWAHRWDVYLRQHQDREVHWFAITNSSLIVLLLSAMVAVILRRHLFKDFDRYNEEVDDPVDLTGWKIVGRDVFRPPGGLFGPMFLSVFVGSGAQVVLMTACVLVFAVLGFLSPANRGGMLSALIFVFVAMGCFAGYTSSRVYKMFDGREWMRNVVLTGVAFPGVVAAVVMMVNGYMWHYHSSAAIPFTTLLAVVALWFFVSLPLVALGAYIGFTQDKVEPVIKPNDLERIPVPTPLFVQPLVGIFVGGLLPFGAVFMEAVFIMSSVWLSHVYYMFGFLFVVMLSLGVVSAEISIVLCYFHLGHEDPNWQWRSFLTPAASGGYLFLYAIYYYYLALDFSTGTAALVYFAYMAIASWAFFLMTGAIGFLSTLAFVRAIYSQIKMD